MRIGGGGGGRERSGKEMRTVIGFFFLMLPHVSSPTLSCNLHDMNRSICWILLSPVVLSVDGL